MFNDAWLNRTLESLENHSWGNPERASTDLIKRCIELTKISLDDFTVENLRLMIGQQIGLYYLIPLAIEKLRQDLFTEGDYYPGDLLSNVLKVGAEFWKKNPELWIEVNDLIRNRTEELNEANISTKNFAVAI